MISYQTLLSWMRSLVVFFLLSVTFLIAKETIEVFAKHVNANGGNFVADEEVVILYNGVMIKSDYAHYDKNASLLTLKGHVEMLGMDDNRVASNKLVIDTSKKSVKFKKLFLAGEDDLWIDSSEASKRGKDYILHQSKISSCNVENPDWTIEFSRAHYHDNMKYITMKDAKLRFFDTTIFYFPYLAFPTNNKRTTGILPPRFGSPDLEGFLYEQPFFYAPTNSLDMEFNPQIRTNRGRGFHTTLRFVDSNHSNGYFRTGYFQNIDSYVNDYNINKEHWGAELFYQSTDVLDENIKPEGYDSGLYVNITHLNDREYLNLQKNSASAHLKSNLIESRVNAFMYDEKDYFGLYGRYNIDTSKRDNYRTLQEIPSLQYHKYLTELPLDGLFYLIDARWRNYIRKTGSQASQTEIDIPLTYFNSFFDNYLDISFSENLYLSNINFRTLEESSKNYQYYRNYHTIELSSDLVKKYDNSIHTIHPSLTYIRPSIEYESLSYEKLSVEQKELFTTQTKEEQLSLGLSQYLYTSNLDMNFFQKMSFTSYPNREESTGDLVHELGYRKDGLNLYSNITYAWNEKQIRSLTSSLGYNQSNYDIMLTHFYNYDFLFDNKKTSFINIGAVYRYNSTNRWFSDIDYDLEQGFNHQWKLGWAHKQKCWDAKISVGQEVIPNREDSFRNSSLYVELNFHPFGGVKQNYEQDFSTEGVK